MHVKYLLFVLLGKKDKLRVYYLSWLRNKILHNDPEVEKKQGWTTVGDLEGCVHYKVGKFLQGYKGSAFQRFSLSFVWNLCVFEAFSEKRVSDTPSSFEAPSNPEGCRALFES